MATQVKHLRDAHWAHCIDHGIDIDAGIYWGLSKSINLHRSGIGSETYATVRDLEYKPCRIILFR